MGLSTGLRVFKIVHVGWADSYGAGELSKVVYVMPKISQKKYVSTEEKLQVP